jgi:hypothetical protein
MKIIKINPIDSIPPKFTGIVEYPDGTKFWYKEGKLHREDGPAREYPDGRKIWHKEGKYHREDGPAVEYPDGTKEWHKEGELHRLDGPAIESPNGKNEWYIEDNPYSPKILSILINSSLYLGKEKGRFNLEWLKFLTEKGIEEFPIIPGMEEDKKFKEIFNNLEGIDK